MRDERTLGVVINMVFYIYSPIGELDNGSFHYNPPKMYITKGTASRNTLGLLDPSMVVTK